MIGLVRADIGDDLLPCAEALSKGGITSLEVAMTTPGAVETLQAAAEQLPHFHFGLGTVLDVETARRGILAGAQFIVTPAPRPAVITLCRRFHIPVISGAFTRADLITAHENGADAVKIFPGDQFGPAYVRALQEKFSHIALWPIGGVTPTTVAEFLRAGAAAVFAGCSLVDEQALEEEDWEEITLRAESFARAIHAAP